MSFLARSSLFILLLLVFSIAIVRIAPPGAATAFRVLANVGESALAQSVRTAAHASAEKKTCRAKHSRKGRHECHRRRHADPALPAVTMRVS